MKMSDGDEEGDHWVPLSRQAVEILERLKDGANSDYVFPNRLSIKRPMSNNTILQLIKRMGYGPNRALALRSRQTGHGFRGMASTWANERKAHFNYDPDAIEKQLAHEERNETRGAYNGAEYWASRRVILQDWADWVEDQSRPAPASNVSRIRIAA